MNQGAQATLEPVVSDVSTGYETRVSYWALFLLTSAALAIPLWTVRFLPLVDFSAHLARCYIIAHASAFSAFYQVHWGVIPNIAIDVVLPPLLRVIRPLLAAKIFLTFTVILYAFAVHFLARSIYGRSTWAVIPALGIFYNNCSLYGFVNYVWGVSFFLLTLGCWLRYRNAPQSRWWAVALSAAIITFFCHLSGYVFLGVVVGVICSYDFLKTRNIRVFLNGWPLLFPLLLYPIYAKTAVFSSDVNTWVNWKIKILHLALWFSGYSLLMDSSVAIIAAVGVLLILWRMRVRFEAPILLAAGALWIGFIVFPFTYRGAYGADDRFILPALLLTILGLSFERPGLSQKIGLGLLVAAVVLRAAFITVYWQDADAISKQQASLYSHVAPGTVMFPILSRNADVQQGSSVLAQLRQQKGRDLYQNRITRHMRLFCGYASVLQNSACPSVFAYASQQPLRKTQPWADPNDLDSVPPRKWPWEKIARLSDYIWMYGTDDELQSYVLKYADLEARAGEGALYRVRH